MTMRDVKLTIRRAVPDDAAAYCALMGDEAVFPGTLQMPYPTEGVWRERLSAKGTEGDLQLVALAEGDILGAAGLMGFSPMRRRHACMLGIAVIGHAQGQGVGTALMKALTDYADRWTTFLRIELTVYADNPNAIALYEKFGFEREGVLRNYSLRDGQFVDVVSMARFHPKAAMVRGRG
jgi:L-phenylalanine/L-methionine N-acetyltransferase